MQAPDGFQPIHPQAVRHALHLAQQHHAVSVFTDRVAELYQPHIRLRPVRFFAVQLTQIPCASAVALIILIFARDAQLQRLGHRVNSFQRVDTLLMQGTVVARLIDILVQHDE